MYRNKSFLLFLSILFICGIFTFPLVAAIKAMNLEEMMGISTGVFYGQIIEKSYFKIDDGDERDVTFTRLTVRGRELTTGESATKELWYMGGIWDGRPDSPSTAPPEHKTRVGARAVFFYTRDLDLIDGGADEVFNFASVYQVQKGAGEETVIGNGKGSAIPVSVKLSDLTVRVRSVYQKLQKQK